MELAAAYIHRQREMGGAALPGPDHQLPAGGFQHPVAQRHDQPGGLGLLDELGRIDQAAPRMLPAHQRFRAGHAPRRIDLRLVVQHELAFIERPAQVRIEQGTGGNRRLHFRVEEAQRVAARLLGLVHGRIGTLHQFIDRHRMIAEQRDADARRAVVAARIVFAAAEAQVQQVGFVEHGLDLHRHTLRLHGGQRLGVEIFENDHELVAAQPRHGVALADAGCQARGDFDQELVADIVPQGIVEGLEIVQIEQHQCAVAAVPGAAGQSLPQAFEHQAAVGQPGQRIVESQMPDLVLRRLAQGDIGKGGDIVGNRTARALHCRDIDPAWIDFTAFAAVPDFTAPGAVLFETFPHRGEKSRIVPP